jgi:hypothetical protein
MIRAPSSPVNWPIEAEELRDLRASMSSPVSSWQGLPVMPDAIAGRVAEETSYVFAARTSLEQVEKFYEERMRYDGWQLTTRQWDKSSVFGGPAVRLDFHRKEELSNIMIAYSPDDNYTVVLLVLDTANN